MTALRRHTLSRYPLPATLVVIAAMACDGGAQSPTGQGGGGAGGSGAGQAGNDTGGGGTNSGGSGGSAGGGGAAPTGPLGNAIWLNGAASPLYPVSDPATGTRGVAFGFDGAQVIAYREDGSVWWEKDVGDGSLFGGFDFDEDGVPDLGLVRTMDTGAPCGSQTILKTSIDVANGRNGDVFPLVAPEDSICWNFSGTVYPTHQWSSLGVLFGAGTSTLATTAYYATEGHFRKWNGGGFDDLGTFVFPSTAAFDATYAADKPNSYGQGTSYVQYAHAANGLLVDANDEVALAFFTSARMVAYGVEALSATQLRMDVPYLTGNRTDIAGRNYGRVEADPGDPSLLVLVSGTSADTMFSDMTTGTMTADPWGQIERHVSIVHLDTGTVDDRFFSYAHDNNDGNQYEGRVVYPNGAFVRTPSGPSRLAFNVYEGGHWMLHVTKPGSTADEVVFKDLFLWDIRDLQNDGTDDWVLSPSRDPEDPDVPGYYYVKWRTLLASWSEATKGYKEHTTVPSAIPLLVPFFRTPTLTTSRSFLYPSITVASGPVLDLLLRAQDGTVQSLTVSAVP